MINKLLLFLMTFCVIGILMACLATSSSSALPIANVTIPHDEIEIDFDPHREQIIPIVSITIPHDEIEIYFLQEQ